MMFLENITAGIGEINLHHTLRHCLPVCHERFDHFRAPAFDIYPQNWLRTRRADEQPRVVSHDVFHAIALTDLLHL